MIIIEVFGIILLSLMFIGLGYIYSYYKWDVHELIKKEKEHYKTIDELRKINDEQNNQIINGNLTLKKNRDWYILQLRTIGNYINEKYSDQLINNQINVMLGSDLEQAEFIKEEKHDYDIDELLDKIDKYGIESLTIDELNFLKNIN